ncbi:hypothetical protein [Amycolatopsis sp. cmx-4-68]|uniref:hypothetical protein n=1 Tax=Amycolatopsis sp. cmx-4-68 TaxID=2790938 RepID=UPI00397DEAA0
MAKKHQKQDRARKRERAKLTRSQEVYRAQPSVNDSYTVVINVLTEHAWVCARRDKTGSFWAYRPSLRTDDRHRARWELSETTLLICADGIGVCLAGPTGEEYHDDELDIEIVAPMRYEYMENPKANSAALLDDLDCIERWVYDVDDVEAALLKFREEITARGWTKSDGPDVGEETMWHYLPSAPGFTTLSDAQPGILPATILACRAGFEVHCAQTIGQAGPNGTMIPPGTSGLSQLRDKLPDIEEYRVAAG